MPSYKIKQKDEIIMELMEILKQNDRKKQAVDVFEMAAMIDMLRSFAGCDKPQYFKCISQKDFPKYIPKFLKFRG